jgi:two-component system NtrC family sensor kinase
VGGSNFRELLWQTLVRQILIYFLPLLLLAVFFHLQYKHLVAESEQIHLEVIAEHQAHTLDLFLRERLINLANVIDDPLFRQSLAAKKPLSKTLDKLQQTSSAFVDVGVVDGEGKLTHYHGPVDFPQPVDYHDEPWYVKLLGHDEEVVITDIYMGFRNRPHFTIAVKRVYEADVLILRAALSPERINEYLTTLEGASEVNASVVSAKGVFQVVTPRVGEPMQQSPYLPPKTPIRGYCDASDPSSSVDFAYAWLSEVQWALVVENRSLKGLQGSLSWMPSNFLPLTVIIFLFMGVMIVLRARQLVKRQLASEKLEAELSGQLVQAAKLASVGELAAGIAHEINNPLAIIAEEIGVLRDMLDPEFAEEGEEMNLEEHLGIMHEAVFRCRDITRKLLSFVRKEEVNFASHDLHDILDEVLDGMLNNELAITNVEVVRKYDSGVQPIMTDRNQLIQVIVNLVKNSIDAMTKGGVLTVETAHKKDRVLVEVKDTGCGMSAEQMERVFTPFFTTKDPGEGTGLGLSVSFSIIKGFGGDMFVNSTPGEGSVFGVELPYSSVE